MSVVKGRNLKIEIAATYATPLVVTAVTLASPGVATSTAHGMANDAVGYFDGVAGMVQLENQACRVKNQATNTFELQGLNTTSYAAFTSGNFTPVATWLTLAESTSYDISGGAAKKEDSTTLIDLIDQEEVIGLSAQSASLAIFAQQVTSAAMAVIVAAARSQAKVTVRATIVETGDVRIWRGEPSLPSESVGVGKLGTGSLETTIKGFALSLAA